jgi:hypothetical protein
MEFRRIRASCQRPLRSDGRGSVSCLTYRFSQKLCGRCACFWRKVSHWVAFLAGLAQFITGAIKIDVTFNDQLIFGHVPFRVADAFV